MRGPKDDDDTEDDIEPLSDADVPEDVLAEFDEELEVAVNEWGDALEAYLNEQRTNGDG